MSAGRATSEGISWLVLGYPPVAVEGGSSSSGRPRLQLLGDVLEFRLLGQLEVLRGGERLALGGHRQRAVLAVLVMEAGRVVSLDGLVDALWGDRPPAGARGTVHAYVSKLRRVLEPHRRAGAGGGLLATRACGYVLEVDPETVDARRFEALAREGRAVLTAGQAEEAARRLAQALAFWRGPPLADFTFDAFAGPEIARLEELRLSVTEDQFDAALGLGRHRAVVAELEPLVAAHPYRERLRAQLMVALYRSGRQAEALAAYQAGRRLLGEELGIDPSPALKDLESAMLRQDPSLDWFSPGAALPVPSPTPGSGTGSQSGETATFLASGLEGTSRLWEKHPALAAVVVARHRELMAQAVVSHGGDLSDENTEGSALGVFSRAGEALAATLALQRALAAEPWPDGITVQVRIGLHDREVAAGQARPRGRRCKAPAQTERRKLGVA